VQPHFTSYIVVLTIHRFREYVSIIPSKPDYLLLQPVLNTIHYIAVALTPHFVAMRKRAGHPLARCLNDVFAYRFGVVWGQLAVPIYDLPR
jgi:hypothetical protein